MTALRLARREATCGCTAAAASTTSQTAPDRHGWYWRQYLGIRSHHYCFETSGPWIYGFLWNQIWDTGGQADTSSMFIQPFLAKGLGKGRTLSLNSESTYNWKSKKWTAPVNLAYSKVSKLGKQMVSNQVGAGLYLTNPKGGADWQLRYALTLLFPK